MQQPEEISACTHKQQGQTTTVNNYRYPRINRQTISLTESHKQLQTWIVGRTGNYIGYQTASCGTSFSMAKYACC